MRDTVAGHITQVSHKSQYIENTENYLQKGKLPTDDFIRLGVNEEFFNDGGEAAPEEGGFAGEEPSPEEPRGLGDQIDKLAEVLAMEDYADLRTRVIEWLQPGKYEFMMKAVAIMVNMELNFVG